MRIIVISDSHTKENIEFILNYIRSKAASWKPDIIIINGDILGENEAREGYGYNFSKTLFYASLNRGQILKQISKNSEKLQLIPSAFTEGIKDGQTEISLAENIREYVECRYDYLFNLLVGFSGIAKTYFNIGAYESPMLYNVLKELSFLLETDESYVRRIGLLANYRDTFRKFVEKVKDPKLKKLAYLGGNSYLEGDLIIAGIPGLNPSTVVSDHASEFQENITKDLMASITRQFSYANKLLLVNQTQGSLRKGPFAFRPASYSVRNFIESAKGKLKQKMFVQSYHHFMSTHFYNASEFYFILNNAAVNNCLFNIIDVGSKIICYDVDPKKDKLRMLKVYNNEVADYSKPEDRLALNYDEPADVIKERNLAGCFYM